MSNKVCKIILSPEFDLLVERYQHEHGLPTKTGALYELIARGWSDWIGELDDRFNDTSKACWSTDDESEATLFKEYDADPEAQHFHQWFAKRFAPKHGGDRKSAAVKKS